MTRTRATVLVVEDDAAIRRGIADALRFARYEVLECADGDSGLAAARTATIDLALLDVVLPGPSGLDILAELRRTRPTLPVILVTARGAEDDRVHGLRGGADDYVVKPFSARELLARVEAVLRRSPERPDDVQRIELGDCVVLLARREVRFGGGTEDGATPDHGPECRLLSEKEAEILAYLARHAGRAVSRDELLQRVWRLDPRGLETRTVDMHIARLREKLARVSSVSGPASVGLTAPAAAPSSTTSLGPAPSDAVVSAPGGERGSADPAADFELIVTVRGKGYMLAEAARVTDR